MSSVCRQIYDKYSRVTTSRLRVALGWSQQQLADRIAEHGFEITAAGISNVENGNKQASSRLLIAWAEAFGLTAKTGHSRHPEAIGRGGMTATVSAIANITIGSRHRHDLGDITALAASIDELGLLHPVVVRSDNMP